MIAYSTSSWQSLLREAELFLELISERHRDSVVLGDTCIYVTGSELELAYVFTVTTPGVCLYPEIYTGLMHFLRTKHE